MQAGWRTACSAAAALALAGCGGASQPRLEHADGAQLIALTHRIAAEGPCAQRRDIPRLQQRAVAIVNTGRVPGELQDTLMSGVNALAAQLPVCLAAVPAATPPPPVPVTTRRGGGHDKPKHGHGHGKHGKHD